MQDKHTVGMIQTQDELDREVKARKRKIKALCLLWRRLMCFPFLSHFSSLISLSFLSHFSYIEFLVSRLLVFSFGFLSFEFDYDMIMMV